MELRQELDADALEVKVAELLVATADGGDRLVPEVVPQVLRLLRERMNMDVVFVSEFTRGERVFRYVDQAVDAEPVIAPGGADPLEASWCQQVVDGRLPGLLPDASKLQALGRLPATPFPIGTHLSAPIVLSNGDVYGTLCCFSFGVNTQTTENDLRKLRYTADLTAAKIERERQQADAALSLEPLQPPAGPVRR